MYARACEDANLMQSGKCGHDPGYPGTQWGGDEGDDDHDDHRHDHDHDHVDTNADGANQNEEKVQEKRKKQNKKFGANTHPPLYKKVSFF